MSALDDALARARATPATPHSETSAGKQEIASATFSELLAETTAQLRRLGVAPLDVYTQRYSEWQTYSPVHEGKAWPLQIFMITDTGEPHHYSELYHRATQYDGSGRSHILEGESHSNHQVDARDTYSVVTYDDADPRRLRFRPWPADRHEPPWLHRSASMVERFPTGSKAQALTYPLDDVIAHAILELVGER